MTDLGLRSITSLLLDPTRPRQAVILRLREQSVEYHAAYLNNRLRWEVTQQNFSFRQLQ